MPWGGNERNEGGCEEGGRTEAGRAARGDWGGRAEGATGIRGGARVPAGAVRRGDAARGQGEDAGAGTEGPARLARAAPGPAPAPAFRPVYSQLGQASGPPPPPPASDRWPTSALSGASRQERPRLLTRAPPAGLGRMPAGRGGTCSSSSRSTPSSSRRRPSTTDSGGRGGAVAGCPWDGARPPAMQARSPARRRGVKMPARRTRVCRRRCVCVRACVCLCLWFFLRCFSLVSLPCPS